jgi:hypothetical protein
MGRGVTMLAVLLSLTLLTFVSAEEPCRSHDCSNDRDGVLGDETLRWDATPDATYYEVRRDESTDPCLSNVADTSVLVAGTACVEPDTTAWLRVRACNDAGCGPWTEEAIEFLPFACFEQPGEECETLCYDGAFLRLEEKYPPCP